MENGVCNGEPVLKAHLEPQERNIGSHVFDWLNSTATRSPSPFSYSISVAK